MIKNNNLESVDLLGVGVGPFNLSLAALLSPIKTIKSYFFDHKNSFIWHPGMLLPGAEIQVSYLKDLVTLVDPTNPFSFISYLAKHKRLYRFINSQFKYVFRVEFNNYLNWVSQSLPNLFFQEKVEDITFAKSFFLIKTTKRTVQSKHLVLGSGLVPNLPLCAKNYIGKDVFHNNDYLYRSQNLKGKKVVVIGGGQSGAEIIQHILANSDQLPQSLTWVTKRKQISPIDDSTFTNEFFTPNYTEYFYHLPTDKRANLLREQVLASDGISLHLLESIYQRLYILECIEQRGRFFNILLNHQLIDISNKNGNKQLVLSEISSNQPKIILADIIILCTGYKWELPSYLLSLSDKIFLENGQFCVNEDFSILWDGPAENRIYVQNASRHTHGIADPNLSLMAWRSAKIINSIAESTIYDLENESAVMDWVSAENYSKEGWKYVANA